MRRITDELEAFPSSSKASSRNAEIVDPTLVALIKEMRCPGVTQNRHLCHRRHDAGWSYGEQAIAKPGQSRHASDYSRARRLFNGCGAGCNPQQ